MSKFLIFLVLSFITFGNIVIKDEVGLLSKDFIKYWESQYKGNTKEIHVLIKESIGEIKPVVYGAEYFRDKDLGGNGSGIVILHVIDKRWVQVITGYRLDEYCSDIEIHDRITKNILLEFKKGNFENGYKFGILNSIKILDEVIK